MRALLPLPTDDVDVHSHYAAGWTQPGGLRVDFVSSLDGAATVDGKSEGLQTRGDNAVFAALRDLADVVLVGGGTARAEGYAPVELPAERVARRREYGFAPVLPTAVISGHLNLDPDAALFTQAPPAARTVVITCAAADRETRSRLQAVADVAICGEDAVDLAAARAALEDRGLRRILCEGGPSLFADLARARVADELCLSLTPLLAGPGALRVVRGTEWAEPRRDLTLAGLLEEEGALFVRYRLPR